ncbi:MAG: NAD(P)H-dependent oxidoreductase subunit E [Sporomusaceae bacterium]|jgi:NADH-quinone oxidoreductase subunit E|nr:NAD(P)H-dependent oxidoreductase subunit E [Sporomusaceae bacterium]
MILSREKLAELLESHPREKRYALAVFQDIQKECGYLPKEHIIDAAAYLNISLAQAYALVTFYRAFSLEPRGKHVIKVCDGTACHIRGSLKVLDCLQDLIGIEPGGTDAEGLFTVEVVNCLGACALSPVMQIGDEYFGSLTDETVTEIITGIRETGEVPG